MMKKTILIMCVYLFVNHVHAQWEQINTVWSPTGGPNGGHINCVASNDSIILIGTMNNGVFISKNSGISWTSSNNGLSFLNIKTIAIKDTLIYLGTNGGGIFRSANNGSTWTSINNGIANLYITSFAFIGNKVIAGTGFGGDYGFLYSSTNNGNSWTEVNNGLPSDKSIFSIAVKGSKIFVGTYNNGLFLSNDTCESWISVNNGLSNQVIFSIAIKDSCIFLGTGLSMYRSYDNGNNWNFINNGLSYSSVNTIAINGNYIYAGTNGSGIFRSSNNGDLWTEMNEGLTNNIIYSMAVHDSLVYAGTNNGLFVASNNGQIWSLANSGLANVNVKTLAANDTFIYAGTFQNGIFISGNNGNNWIGANNGLYPNYYNTTVNSFLISGSKVFAGTDCGVFLSTDSGDTWVGKNNGLHIYQTITSLTQRDTCIFAGTQYDNVYKSINYGNNWFQSSDGLNDMGISLLSTIGNRIYAGAFGGLYASDDDGHSWSLLNGLPTNSWKVSIVNAGTNIFAGFDYGGVYLSTDNGTNWILINDDLLYVTTSLENYNTILFAGTEDIGVCTSTDNGTSWTTINDSLPVSKINCLLTNNGFIYAGTGMGVFKRPVSYIYKSNNTIISNSSIGNQWYNAVNHTIINGATNQNFIPTQSGSYYNIVTINGYNSAPSNIIDFTLGINNAYNDNSITIKNNSIENKLYVDFSNNLSNCYISIYNTIGQELIKIKSSNNHTIIDTYTLNGGVYFVQVSNGSIIKTQKFVKL